MSDKAVSQAEVERKLASEMLDAARTLADMDYSEDALSAGESELVAVDALRVGIPVDAELEARIRVTWLSNPTTYIDKLLEEALEKAV